MPTGFTVTIVPRNSHGSPATPQRRWPIPPSPCGAPRGDADPLCDPFSAAHRTGRALIRLYREGRRRRGHPAVHLPLIRLPLGPGPPPLPSRCPSPGVRHIPGRMALLRREPCTPDMFCTVRVLPRRRGRRRPGLRGPPPGRRAPPPHSHPKPRSF